MKKICINGNQYVAVRSIREEIRFLRKNVDMFYYEFDEDHRAMVQLAYNDIVQALYREELAAAKTPEDVEAIMEMPGEFIVIRRLGKRKAEAFKEWKNKEAVVGKLAEAMIFSYESMAESVAEKLGEGWSVMDVSRESYERTKKLLDAIFADDREHDA